MLSQLRIKNFALIDDLMIEYEPGLNVLTGETGAGKSIVLGALSLLLGERVEPEMIRTGATSCEVEGIFNFHPDYLNQLQNLLPASVQLNQNEPLIIRRKVETNGRSYSYLNDSSVTTNTLKKLGDFFVDLHGQHEHQSLLKPEFHREVLDEFAKLDLKLTELNQLFKEYQDQKAKLSNLSEQIKRRKERRELDEFQYQELKAAQLKLDEEAELLQEKTLLETAEKRFRLAQIIKENLSETEGSLLEQLDYLQKQLAELVEIDPTLVNYREELKTARSILDELWHTIIKYQQHIEFSPQRLETVNERLFLIERLKKKYNRNVEGLLALQDELAKNLSSIEIDESQIVELNQNLGKKKQELIQLAKIISQIRYKAKSDFEAKLQKELSELGMAQARFIVKIQPILDETGLYEENGKKYRLDENGIDSVEFLFSANPGEEPKPLRKVASGGELSRIMLALKSVIAGKIPILVFDEIDLGIGGKVADTVGKKLAKLAKSSQVICITHLPQIAKYAFAHYRVSKEVKSGRTKTTIERLNEEERVNEIARMLAGAKISKTTLTHAREILKETKI